MEDKAYNLNEEVVKEINRDSALIVVDMQYDFLPNGALAVPKGDEIIKPINEFLKVFNDKQGTIIFTQDWHPKDHLSFAENHEGKKAGDPIQTKGLGPVLWPAHCVQGGPGAEIHKDLDTNLGDLILRKGTNPEIDSYSAFFENDGETRTGLSGYLKDRGIKKIFVCGLALDYCCYYTAKDAKREGFDVIFLEDLTRGIDIPENNIKNAKDDMEKLGIKIINAIS
ncbi:MAG: bifunctional nicotinamidase/pyrazinamidase [Promethearchaeota archaeon]